MAAEGRRRRNAYWFCEVRNPRKVFGGCRVRTSMLFLSFPFPTDAIHQLDLTSGGRLLKGETFFAAAIRKAHEETGLTDACPIQVLGVWNTFFPTSHWDTAEHRGTQTVNPIVLVELEDQATEIQLDSTSESYRWMGLDPVAAQANGEDRYVVQALLRLQAWDPEYFRTFG
jgi:ADP-ribose pyrophosphatase YjhB (NUDIX family)